MVDIERLDLCRTLSMKIKIVVVAHGACVKCFMKDLSGSPREKETMKERSLMTYGVDF